jgi:hypothetical protein
MSVLFLLSIVVSGLHFYSLLCLFNFASIFNLIFIRSFISFFFSFYVYVHCFVVLSVSHSTISCFSFLSCLCACLPAEMPSDVGSCELTRRSSAILGTASGRLRLDLILLAHQAS